MGVVQYFNKIVYFLFFFGVTIQSLLGQPTIIQVGSDNSFFPFEYLDDEKKPAGFDIDLLHALVKESGLEVQITTGDWFIIKDQMKNGKFDMLAGMYYYPDRAELFDFSMPYIIITHSIFVKNGNKIRSLNELKEDKSIRVVVENSSILHKYLTSNGVLPERILAVENQLDALLLVDDSYTTCALLPELQARFIAKKNGLDDIKTVGLPILPREYAFAISKGDTALLNTINAGLTRLHQTGEYKKIFKKWFGEYNPTFSVLEKGYSIFWLICLFLAVILFFVYYFMQFRLKKLVTENKNLNSELRQTNLALKEVHKSETLLKRIIEFSPYPIAMIHEDDYFVFTNSGFEDLFGKQSTKMGSVNRWLSLALKKEDEQNFIKNHFFYNPKDLITQGTSSSKVSLTTKTGEETMMQLFFVSLGNGQLLIFFSQDENNLESAKQQDSSKNKSKDTKSLFLPHFSHDIRSPLNIIMGFSGMIKTEDLSIEEMKSYAGMIHQNGQMLLYLLRNMGTLSKIDSGELPFTLEYISVFDLINTVYKQFKGIDHLEDSDEIGYPDNSAKNLVVNADREILSQTLLNLLFYFAELAKGKAATIGCESTEKNEVHFLINANIEKETYQSLLQKTTAFQEDSDDTDQFFSSGKGLSLYISLVLIKLLGSKVEISRNESSNMLKFAFSLPNFSNDHIAQNKKGRVPKKSQKFKWEGKRILIADDNTYSLDYFKLIIKSSKAEIIVVKDGREAYDQCRKETKIDVVLMDWSISVMDGETCTKLIKQLEPTLPVIAFTNSEFGDNKHTQIIQSGCDAYFPKPVDWDKLLNYINSLFEN